MNAQDFMNTDNNRADAVAKLQALCDALSLSYEYSEKEFSIKLPYNEPIPVAAEKPTLPSKQRKTFDTSGWGERTYVEGEEPDPEQPLEEGEPPKEQL